MEDIELAAKTTVGVERKLVISCGGSCGRGHGGWR
jgi:hypothetical protein